MADEAPDAPPLMRQSSFEEHAKVFDDLFARQLEAGQATLNDLASGAPEETLEKVRELGEAGAKVMEGDSEEGKRALEEFAARFNTDMSAELEAVWTEYDKDGSGYLDEAECRDLVKGYLTKQKEFLPRQMRESMQASMGMMMGLMGAMGGGEEGGPDTNEVTDFMNTLMTTIFDSLTPIIEEASDGMLADSDRLADELFPKLDTDADGRVSKDEFVAQFTKQSQQVFQPEGLQERVQGAMMGAMGGAMAGMPGGPGDDGGADGGDGPPQCAAQ